MTMTKADVLAGVSKVKFTNLKLLRQMIEALASDVVTAQTLTASGTVNTDTDLLNLDHTTVAIAATLDVSSYYGSIIIRAISEPGVAADHTLTVSGGTLDGTNTVATFADVNDSITVNFDGTGTGTITSNIGAVVLS